MVQGYFTFSTSQMFPNSIYLKYVQEGSFGLEERTPYILASYFAMASYSTRTYFYTVKPSILARLSVSACCTPRRACWFSRWDCWNSSLERNSASRPSLLEPMLPGRSFAIRLGKSQALIPTYTAEITQETEQIYFKKKSLKTTSKPWVHKEDNREKHSEYFCSSKTEWQWSNTILNID